MNKPKIDLKARLGRRTGGPPMSASIPPPQGVGSPYSNSGVPMSAPGSFAPVPSQPRQSYDPMGVAPVVQVPAPMHISAPMIGTAEVEAEMAAVRSSGRQKVIVLAAVAAVVGGIIGFAVGGLSEKNKVAEAAVIGAKALTAEIDAANAAANKLHEVLAAAGKSLKDGAYPENEIKDLGGINIPFDGSNLAGKSIGRYRPQLITMLINYAGATVKANDQKDRIRSLLTISKEPLQDMLASKTNPMVHWGVAIQSGPQGPWGALQPLPAFSVNGEKGKAGGWPSEFTSGDGKTTMRRYVSGDPTRGDAQIIPIAPQTQTVVCPTDTLVRLRRELSEMDKVLVGDETPGQEVQGLATLGDAIKKQLASIGS